MKIKDKKVARRKIIKHLNSIDTRLKESDIILNIKEILAERKQMPRKMELKFVY